MGIDEENCNKILEMFNKSIEEKDREIADIKLNYEIENVLNNCYTGNDFMTECSGYEDLARELFDFVDWQHPNIQDLLDLYSDEEFEREHGFSMEELI